MADNIAGTGLKGSTLIPSSRPSPLKILWILPILSKNSFAPNLLDEIQIQKCRNDSKVLLSEIFYGLFQRRDIKALTITACAKQLSKYSRWMGGQLLLKMSFLNEFITLYKTAAGLVICDKD